MAGIERIGVSLEKDLLKDFDRLIKNRGYESRSEAIRDLVRRELSEENLADPFAETVAAICLVYDHHNAKLSQKLLHLQHSHLLKAISSMHIHLSHHDCLEIIVLKGPVGEIKRVADSIVSIKGVTLGKISLISVAGEGEHEHPHEHH
jgi:CopG family transcriptional regulator, nickel-responsive regulator